MPQDESLQSLTHFYDTHLVEERLILQRIQNQGVSLETLSEEILKGFDMDHYGGTDAVDFLADKAGIDASSSVLDVCCGIGGPARYLAYRYGCHVMGLDITESRIQSAHRLTKMVKLDHLVDFRLGNALDMPFEDNAFDVVIGQEAWVHIPDKPRLLAQCARTLKSKGMIAFTDFLRREALQADELERWQQHWGGFAMPETFESYGSLLAEVGFTLLEREDLSPQWASIVAQRAALNRSLQDEIVKLHSEEIFRQRDATRQFMTEMFAAGKIGGGRFVARLDDK